LAEWPSVELEWAHGDVWIRHLAASPAAIDFFGEILAVSCARNEASNLRDFLIGLSKQKAEAGSKISPVICRAYHVGIDGRKYCG
jgi:hypothetical protein